MLTTQSGDRPIYSLLGRRWSFKGSAQRFFGEVEQASCRAPALPWRCPVDFPSVAVHSEVKTGRNLGASPGGVLAVTD